MNGRTILVIDDDPKNLEILVGGLVANQFQVLTSSSGYDGLEKAKKMKPDLILLDTEVPDLSGNEFMSKLRKSAEASDIPVIFLSTREGVQDRIKAYLEGAKDYIVKPMHLSEIVARVRMILSRLERRAQEKEEKTETMKGTLEQKNLASLIEELGMKQATGILSLSSSSGKSGQVFFREGKIMNAIAGTFRGERAIYRMIPWASGQYHFVEQFVDIKDEIGLSNLGLLVQAKRRLKKREELLAQLPSGHTVFTLSSIFLKIIEKRKLQPDVVQFIQLFDGQRSVLQIVEDSYYDDLVTLERIAKMYEQGFLTEIKPQKTAVVEEEKEPPPRREAFFTEEEYETFVRRVLRAASQKRRALLVLGTAGSGKSDFVRIMVGNTYRTKTLKNILPHPVDMGKFQATRELELTVLGIPVEKTLRVFVETLEDNMLGYIILISAIEPETFDYISYLIKTFRNRYQLPYAIAITNLRHPQAMEIETLAQRLGLESYEELLSCNPQDPNNIKMILLNMYSSFTSREYLKIPTPVSEYNN